MPISRYYKFDMGRCLKKMGRYCPIKLLIITFHRTLCTSYNKQRKKALLIHDICQDKYALKTKMEEMHMFIFHAQCLTIASYPGAYPGIWCGGGGFQQIQLRKEDRENGDLGLVAP
jgi:hypothetical protein